MKETPLEKPEEMLVVSSPDDQIVSESSPNDEYEKALKRHKTQWLLFAIFLVVEVIIGTVFGVVIHNKDLHYRSIAQLENSISGKITLPKGTYTGETEFGYFIGDASFLYNTGATYNGHWNNNEMSGLGVLNIPSEGKYDGSFVQSQKSGTGTFTWEDGSVYAGEWKNDQMNGQGVYTSHDKVVYSGTFEDNRFKIGSCCFSNSTGEYQVQYKEFQIDNLLIVFPDGARYDGNADNGKLSGSGTMTFASGDCYVGEFSEGYRNGNGVYTWQNGDKYDGSWSNDVMTGSGTYTYHDGSCASGTFNNNLFISGSYSVVNSFGEYTFTIKDEKAVSVQMKLVSGTSYSGDMKDDKLTGSAQISYSNGDTYSGKVSNGAKDGQGTYVWVSGASYEGSWSEDKMNGSGTYFYPKTEKGYKLTGHFDNGVPDGECQYNDGSKSYKTDWTKGRCVKIYE